MGAGPRFVVGLLLGLLFYIFCYCVYLLLLPLFGMLIGVFGLFVALQCGVRRDMLQ